MYTNQYGKLAEYTRLQQLIGDPSEFWTPILRELFDVILFTKLSIQWDISRPLFSVYLVYEKAMNDFCCYLCEGCNEEATKEIVAVFQDISKMADRSLDCLARETFSIELSKWVRKLKEYAVHRNEFYICLLQQRTIE